MPEDPANTPAARRGRRLFWLLIGAVVLLPIGWLGYLTFGPNPPIRVSKETTHITAPLAADGLPDYAAAIRAHIQRDTTPDQNGAIPFLEAMWIEGEEALSPEDAKLVCDELGMPCPPPPELRISDYWSDAMRREALRLYRKRVAKPAATGEAIANPIEYEDELLGYDMNDAAFWSAEDDTAIYDYRIDELLDVASGRAWTEEELPFVAGWIDGNRKGFERLLEAVRRPRWYLPEPGLLTSDRHADGLLGLSEIQQVRNASRYLTIAMGRCQGEGSYDEAAEYALGLLRLAAHLSSEAYLVDHMVAIAIEGVGMPLVGRLAADAGTPRKTLLELRDRLRGLRRPNALSRFNLTGERLFSLAYALAAYHAGVDSADTELFGAPNAIDSIRGVADRMSVDWNVVLAASNRLYDELENAISQPTRRQSLAALETIDADIAARAERVEQRFQEPLRFLTPASRGELVADGYLSETFFNYTALVGMDDRNQVQHDLNLLLLAAAIHRADTGEWPESLDDIDPKVLGEPPTDTFNGLPYVYRRTEDGVLLYSLGENGVDDGGSREAGDAAWESSVFEGVEIEAMLDDASDTLTAEERAAYDLIDKIPEGADDVSLRVPLPVEPWPWE